MRDDMREEERDKWGEERISIEKTSCPQTILLAGWVWIIFGAVGLLNTGANLMLSLSRDSNQGAEVCPAILGLLFALVFIHVGVQSLGGKAKDTLGNGIGSIVFGLLNGFFGVALLNRALTGRDVVSGIIGGVCLLAALGLITAGGLALAGRNEYKAWRQDLKRQREREAYDRREEY
jgi:hypothetical protein